MAESIGEAVRSASNEIAAHNAKPEVKETVRESPERETTQTGEDEDFGAPKWTKQWKKPTREALKKLHQLAKDNGADDAFGPVYKEIEERYDYTGKTQAEYDRLRKRWEPYDPVIGSLEQRFAVQGVHPQTGLQQMAAVSDLLQRDPDQGLAYLAQMFRPRDVQAFVKSLAQNYGVDLGGIAAEAPYIDPAVRQLFEPLQQQNQQLWGMLAQQRQQEFQQRRQQVETAMSSFVNAKDANGELKHPHFRELDEIMAKIYKADPSIINRPDWFDQLYDQAMRLHPNLSEEWVSRRIKSAESKALEDASRQTQETSKAVSASRNITGGVKQPADKKLTTYQAIRAEHKRLAAGGKPL